MSDNIIRRIAATVTAATSTSFHLVFSIVVIIFQFRLVWINCSSDDDALRPAGFLTNFTCIGSVLTSIGFVLGRRCVTLCIRHFRIDFFFVILDYCYCLRTIPSLRKLEYSNDWSLSIDHHWSYRIFMFLWVRLWFHRRPTRTSSSHFRKASSIQCMTSVFVHLY